MSSFLPTRFVVALLLLPAVGAPAQSAPSSADIARAVQQLGSGTYRQRQRASQFLWESGRAAEPALQQALRSPDREIARRARAILEKFKYGIYPDTPPKVVELINTYRSGTTGAKRTAIAGLGKLGTPGHAVLIKLATLEENPGIRRELFEQLTGEVVPALLADGRLDEVEKLLELGLKGADEKAERNYAAFLYLTGRLDARLPAWTARSKKLTGFQEAEVLMYLCRAKGDLAGALKAARRTDKRWLVASILYEMADWKELAENADAPLENATPFQQLSFLAAYHRLAGNAPAFAKALADIQDQARLPGNEKEVAIALLLNDRPREAIDLLLKRGTQPSFTFNLLCAQHRYKEAFDLAGKAGGLSVPVRERERRDHFDLVLALARTHAVLGDADQVVRDLDHLAAAYTNQRDFFQYVQIIKTAVQLGLTEKAFSYAEKVLPQAEKQEILSTVFKELYPDREDQAEVWWTFFRQKFPKEDIPDILRRVRRVMENKLTIKDFIPLARELEKAALAEPPQSRELPHPEVRRGKWLQALGETCLAYDRQTQGRDYLEKAGTPEALTRLGDLEVGKKRWAQAAEWYHRAWLKDRSQAGPLYLYGWALEQAGKREEGRKAKDLAHLIPLANDHARYQLAQALARHNLKDAVRREEEFIVRTGRFRFAEVSNSLRMLAIDAYTKNDFRRAAVYQERTQLECLGYIYFVRPSAYLTVPASAHHIRAMARIVEGKIAEALRETDLDLAFVPGDLEMAIHVVPALEKRGRKKEADKLFGQVFDTLEKVSRDYPKSAQMHNSAAWLAVCCRREMEKALAHAQKAVTLAPKSPGYLDTLAEIYYQRGDKAKALELMKKCARMDPKSDYYQKQLKRFAAPGPPSETPR